MELNYMKQEEKDLLLRDLCARLPYKVKVTTTNAAVKFGVISGISIENKISVRTKHADIVFNCTEVKPYLFPMSSMTEEQKYELYCRFIENDCDFNDFKEFYLDNGMWHKMLTSLDDIEEIIDWFNKNHFDFRCLIPKGLAIDATNLNIY